MLDLQQHHILSVQHVSYQAWIQDSRFQDQDQNQDSMNNMAKLMQITWHKI